MRFTTRLLVVVILASLTFTYAPTASACEECAQYFDWQATDWCWYCRATSCGYFNCVVREYGAWGEHCSGDDAGCFEANGNCALEPTVSLNESWRLESVRVVTPQPVSRTKRGATTRVVSR